MKDQLSELVSHLACYREAVDHLLFPDALEAKEWRLQLLNVLISVSQLYLDYLLLMRELPALEADSAEAPLHENVRADIEREARLRNQLKERLESVPHWNQFDPENAFSEFTGLRTLADYINSFALHLPEIYEESLRVENRANLFLIDHSHSSLVQLAMGMEHMGRCHISFVQQPLEWAVNEQNWDES